MIRKLIDRLGFAFYKFYRNRENRFAKKYYNLRLTRIVGNIGRNSLVNGEFQINCPQGLIIGNNVHLGKGLRVDARGGVIISDHSHISRNVTIYSTNHFINGTAIPYNTKLNYKSVIIGEGVWIGMGVAITPGVTIGRGAIIGMGSVISRDIAEGEIVVSNKQRVVGNRDMNCYEENDSKKRYGGPSGKQMSAASVENFNQSLLELGKGENIVFVLSTGRAGSKTITDVFEDTSRLEAHHESYYQFLGPIGVEYLSGKIDEEHVRERLLNIFSASKKYQKGKLYLESDQKLVPFIMVLADLFPKARFVWLLRKPISFAISATARGWFDKGDEVAFENKKVLLDDELRSWGVRITPNALPESNYNENYGWDNLTVFERNLWYWKYWNKLIYDSLNQIENRSLLIKLEEFESGLEEFSKFLDIGKKDSLKVVRSNSAKKSDKVKLQELKSTEKKLISSNRIDVNSSYETFLNFKP